MYTVQILFDHSLDLYDTYIIGLSFYFMPKMGKHF